MVHYKVAPLALKRLNIYSLPGVIGRENNNKIIAFTSIRTLLNS